MSFMRIFHVYTGGHIVVVVLVKQQKYTFDSTVNVEIVSKMFENINKSNFVAKYLKKKMLIEPYNDGKVNHFCVPH